VQQKIVEHYKIETGCKKIAKALKCPILTIRAIIKKFQSICQEEDVCLYCPNARRRRKFEWLSKDHRWKIAEIT